MFTGLIEKTAEILNISGFLEKKLVLNNPFENKIKQGDSIAVDGICLTVENFTNSSFEVFLSKETLKKTIANFYKKGTVVNLERALSFSQRFDGHIVQGHIDCVGTIGFVKKIGKGMEIKVLFPSEFGNLIVKRGSIALNGVSLTTFEVEKNAFYVSLIPESLNNTTFFKQLNSNQKVNLEFDILGK
jgi:riboflavin synthase